MKILYFSILFIGFILLSCVPAGANNPPSKPSNPYPDDGATNVSIDVVLSWDASDPDGDPITFDVYFGTEENPPLVEEGLTEKRYTPGELEYSTTYYWKIVVRDEQGNKTEGPIWSFTTQSVSEVVVFQDDFESYTVGSTPSRWDRYWYKENGYAEVVEDGNPSKALRFYDPDEESAVEVEEGFDPISAGYLEFDFKIEDERGTFVVDLENSGFLQISYSPDEGKIYLMAMKEGIFEKLVEVQKDIWYSVRMEFDFKESERVDIHLNGEYVGYGNFYDEELRSMRFLTYLSDRCQGFLIDNVKLVSIGD